MKKWPIFFNERLWLVNPREGYIGVVTLWTPKEKIGPMMTDKVAAVGQLYTKGGIQYIVRNLWAKPQISTLVVCGRDATKSGQALKEFFQKGTIDGQSDLFDGQIPVQALEILRKKVGLVDLVGEADPRKIVQKVAKLKRRPPFAQRRREFSLPDVPQAFPSETSLFRIEAPTVALAWLQILKTITRFGWEIPRVYVYGGKERMVLNLAAIVTDEDMKNPKVDQILGFGKREMKAYFKEFFRKDRGDQAYTYGERLFDYFQVDQITIMVQKLQQFASNKGALSTLWQPTIDNFPKRKPWRTPCLTLIQGICQEKKLHLTAYFRSNDMFNAWPLNALALRQLQTVLAEKISQQVGVLTTISQSAFIEEHDLPIAEKIIKENDRLFCSEDPRGNLVISLVGKEIVVRHFSPEGRFLQEFKVDGQKPKAAHKMTEKLLKSQVISRLDHALDIGEQLGRAEDAVKLGLKFEQDQNLKKG